MIRLFILLILSFANPLYASSEWSPYTQQEHLQIQYRYTSEDLLQIQVQAEVISRLGAFLHLLEDTGAIHDWVYNAASAHILQQPDIHTHIVHTQIAGTWPVARRDMITRSQWHQNVDSYQLTLEVESASDYLPEQAGVIRMTDIAGTWILTPGDNQTIHIHYLGHADPAGRIPRSIARRAALRATLITFERLPDILKRYQRDYPGIQEPY